MAKLKSNTEILKELRAQPGISIPHLSPGTKVLVETVHSIFEFTVVDYEHVEVTSTDHRFHKPVVGRFIRSVYDMAGTMEFPHWIGNNLRMELEFRNAMFRSTPVVSACVIGKGYKYDVF
jgi:hypothetical protein